MRYQKRLAAVTAIIFSLFPTITVQLKDTIYPIPGPQAPTGAIIHDLHQRSYSYKWTTWSGVLITGSVVILEFRLLKAWKRCSYTSVRLAL